MSLTDHRIDWMMMWLSKRPEWTRARELSISTQSFGVGDIASLVEGEEDGNDQNKIRVTEGMWTKQVLTMR
jgi:hypothetical protein